MLHLCHQVLKCSEQDLLDQRRMMLTINQHGNVVTVSASTPKSLFGFSPSDVIGTPLSGFVNVFDEWCKKGNKSTTLLSKLASREQVRRLRHPLVSSVACVADIQRCWCGLVK